MKENLEIQYVTIADRQIPAIACICPVCKILDLNMTVNTLNDPWIAVCTRDHSWPIRLEIQ
jgi:hypothetical protein